MRFCICMFMTNTIPNHDSFIRGSLANIELARAFIETYLPASIKKIAKLDSLKIEPTTFIDEQHKTQIADILYSLMFNNELGYVYINIEHQSRADKFMPLRMLKYLCRIFEHHLKQYDDKQLPLVIPMLIYNGQVTPYPFSTDIFDLFSLPDLAQETIFKPIQLIDLTTIPDDELLQHRYLSIMEMLAKHIYARDLAPIFKKLKDQGVFVDINSIGSGDYLRLTLNYVLSKSEASDVQQTIELLEQALPQHRGDIMTIAEALELKGLKKGLEQGLEQGMHAAHVETAKKLIARGNFNETDIAELSGLAIDEVRKLLNTTIN